MNLGLFLGVTACVLLVWYLYRRSKNGTSEDTKHESDDADTVDGADDDYEDLLLTGLVLNEVYDDDDSDADMDTDEYDSMDDGGGFDDGGYE